MLSRCPDDGELLAFHLGTAPDEDAEALAEHLEACDSCEATIRRIEATADPVLSALRLPATAGPAWARWGKYTESGRVGGEPSDAGEPASWPDLPDYEVIDYLGRGGMGVVYKARDRRLGRLVALKRLPSGDPRELRRSRLEAETLARMQHPNIVQLYEMPEHKGRLYLAMELVDGEPLADHLDRPHPPLRTAVLMEGLARAVHYAHGHGIVHRDLKPSNIMLAGLRGSWPEGRGEGSGPLVPKVMDFGVAKRLAATAAETRSGDVIGTPSYMSPEQAAGEADRVGPATDVYSLGVILYEMVTGRVPLQGPTTLDTLLLVRHEEPVPPRRFQPKVPRDLETICLKCLQKEPGDRYATAADLAVDLGLFLAGEPIRARPTPAWERAWKRARRRPLVAGLSAAVVVVAAVGLGLVAWQWRRASDEAAARAVAARLAEEETRKGELLLAGTSLSRGAVLCETGELNAGLNWLARALELAARTGDVDIQRVARSNLAAWEPFLVRQRAGFPHAGWVWTVAISPDGRTALTGGSDRKARLWDTASFAPIGPAMDHDQMVWSVAFSPDGRRVLTGGGAYDGKPGEARIWDAATGAPIGPSLPHPSRVTAARFRPDGRAFLTVCDEGARLWSSETRQPIGSSMVHSGLAADPKAFRRLDAIFSPDGRLVATAGNDGEARLWDAADGTPRGGPIRAAGPITAIAFGPDARTLATGGRDGSVELWDVATGDRRGPAARQRGPIKAIAFSPDGAIAAAAGVVSRAGPEAPKGPVLGGEVQLWETATGRAVGRPIWHPRPVWSLAFSPGGRVLMTGCEDTGVRFFLPTSGQPVGRERGGEGTVTAVAFSPDGALAMTASAGGDNRAEGRLWQMPNADALPRPIFQPGGVSSLTLSPDGRTLLTGSRDRLARLWDLEADRPIGSPLAHEAPVSAVAFSPDGASFLTADEGGSVRLRDRRSLRPLLPELKTRPVSTIAFSPDGRTFLLGDLAGLIQWREAATGNLIREYSPAQGPIRAIALRPADEAVAIVSDFGVRIIAPPASRDLGTWPGPPGGNAAAFFPGAGDALVTNEGVAHFRDLPATGARSRMLVHGAGRIARFALSPDGRSALITGADHVTRLWDLATGRALGPPLALDEIVDGVFSRDGRRIAVATPDGRVSVWDVPAPDRSPAADVRARLERLTGAALDDAGTLRDLSSREVADRRPAERTGGTAAPP